jgi:hypothetical protein
MPTSTHSSSHELTEAATPPITAQFLLCLLAPLYLVCSLRPTQTGMPETSQQLVFFSSSLLSQPQTDNHRWNCNARNQRNHHRRTDERAQLPQQFLLPRPGLGAPESASRRTEIVEICDFLLAQPAELRAAHGAHHVVARAIVDFDYQHLAAWAWLDVVAYNEKEG